MGWQRLISELLRYTRHAVQQRRMGEKKNPVFLKHRCDILGLIWLFVQTCGLRAINVGIRK